jgi:ABC-type dipeptide/oligopeptide/nickel transport system permease component
MISYTIRRLLILIPTTFAAVSFLFVLFFALPGDPAKLIAGGGNRTPDAGVVQRINDRYGLDDPLLTQFGTYWRHTIKFDLGESYLNRRNVNDILSSRAVNSLRLASWAIIIEIVVGISVGLLSALRRYSVWDKITTIVTAVASAIPVFVLGFILQFVFAVLPNKWGWPAWAHLRTQGIGPNSWSLFLFPRGDQWRYLILPAITLASVTTALAARMTRGSMLEVLRADFMRTARAKGLRERSVILRHGLRNAMLPVITLIGLDFGTAIGVAVLTETTFSWPGIGSTIADSVINRDLPVLLGFTLVVVLAYALINLLVDLSYAWFDPRIRLGRGGDR